MKRTIQLMLFALLINSCENNDLNVKSDLTPGTYKGHFIRSSPSAKYAPSNITLTFTADSFAGESSVVKYPAICNGTYKITGQEIEFFNNCPWTAEFDWSLILSGKFKLNVDGGQLEMTRHSNGQTDYYKLKLQ
jgi:hypothetical protein